MAEVYVVTRHYETRCMCSQRGSYGPKKHGGTCGAGRVEIILLGLAMITGEHNALDQTWKVWEGFVGIHVE